MQSRSSRVYSSCMFIHSDVQLALYEHQKPLLDLKLLKKNKYKRKDYLSISFHYLHP